MFKSDVKTAFRCIPALRSLTDSLPDVALAGRAPNTATKYSATYARLKRWARDQSLLAFLASPYHFSLYVRLLMAEAKTAAPIESVVHVIAWVHHLAEERSPSEHPLVKDVLAGAHRLLAHHISKKEPITVAQLEQLVNSLNPCRWFLYMTSVLF